MNRLLSADAHRLYPHHGGAGLAVRALLNPRFWPVILVRVAHCLRRRPWRVLGLAVATVNWLVFRVECALDTEIGGGLFIPHGNVIIGAKSIGTNFTIFSGCVIGAKMGDLDNIERGIDDSRPVIGDRVTMFANAVVVGPVVVRNRRHIGACTLVKDSADVA